MVGTRSSKTTAEANPSINTNTSVITRIRNLKSNSTSKDSKSIFRMTNKAALNDPLAGIKVNQTVLKPKDSNIKVTKSAFSEIIEQPRKLRNTGKSFGLNFTHSKTDKENTCKRNESKSEHKILSNKNELNKIQMKRTSGIKASNTGNREVETKVQSSKEQKSNEAVQSRLRFPKWITHSVPSLKRGKKRACDTNIYDLDQDEDLMMEIQEAKKADIKIAKVVKTKRAVRKKPRKEVSLNSKAVLKQHYRSQISMFKAPCKHLAKQQSVASKYDLPLLAVNAVANKGEIQFSKVKLFGSEPLTDQNHDHLEGICEDTNFQLYEAEKICIEVTKRNSEDSASKLTSTGSVHSESIDASNEIACASINDKGKLSEIYATPEKKKSKVDHLLEDLERSFLFQPMTSTPEEKESPPVDDQLVSRKSIAAKVLDIPPIASQSGQGDYFHLPLELLEEESTNGSEITLFESPIKDDKKVTEKSTVGHDQILKSTNLHHSQDLKHSTAVTKDENLPLNSETKELINENTLFLDDLDCSPVKAHGLKPRKSYQSPHEFRKYIVKTKRDKARKEKQTKEEKIIENMNKHFSEVEDTVLCIE